MGVLAGGRVKVVTAAASIGTAIILGKLVPRVLKIPSVNTLHEANEALTSQAAATRQNATFYPLLAAFD
jgi:hypothetical protein